LVKKSSSCPEKRHVGIILKYYESIANFLTFAFRIIVSFNSFKFKMFLILTKTQNNTKNKMSINWCEIGEHHDNMKMR